MKYLPMKPAKPGHAGYQQQVKEANIKRIFDLIRAGKCSSRAQIVREMQLSATSVSVLVEELKHRGLVSEAGPTQTFQPGRRPIGLQLKTDTRQIMVFSLHCEGVRYALLDLGCNTLESGFCPLDPVKLSDRESASYEYVRLFDDILQNQSRLYDPSRVQAICISISGVYIQDDDAYHMGSALGTSLSEQPLRQFQRRVKLPLYVCGASRSLAYAEKKRLDAADPDAPEILDLLFVEIRERISCAIISGGNIYTGPYNVAGEIGHFTIDYKGRPCPCGNVGCLERYVNLHAILEDARQAARVAKIAEPRDLESLARRYPDEPALFDSVRQSAQLLAFGLYSVMCSSGMQRIVLGGGIEVLGDAFLHEVYRALYSRSLLIKSLDLSYAKAGPDAEFLGIAHHYLDKAFTITG